MKNEIMHSVNKYFENSSLNMITRRLGIEQCEYTSLIDIDNANVVIEFTTEIMGEIYTLDGILDVYIAAIIGAGESYITQIRDNGKI